MPPSTPFTVTVTASPAIALPHYSLSSGWPGIYGITQVIIPVIWITVLLGPILDTLHLPECEEAEFGLDIRMEMKRHKEDRER